MSTAYREMAELCRVAGRKSVAKCLFATECVRFVPAYSGGFSDAWLLPLPLPLSSLLRPAM
jgi:hypothetical protein